MSVEICDLLVINVSECIVLLYGLLFTVLKIFLLIQLNIVWINLFIASFQQGYFHDLWPQITFDVYMIQMATFHTLFTMMS